MKKEAMESKWPVPPFPAECVVLLIGLPGAGKTTWLQRRQLPSLSTDHLRHLLFDREDEQRFQSMVFALLRHALRLRLQAGMARTWIDATNLSPAERRPLIAIAREYGFPAGAVFFDIPVEECLKRNRARGRQVEDAVIRRMELKLRPPRLSEGFSAMARVTGKGRMPEPYPGPVLPAPPGER